MTDQTSEVLQRKLDALTEKHKGVGFSYDDEDWVLEILRTALKDTEHPSVYADIQAERTRQDAQWGGPEHDDAHVEEEWRYYRERFEARIANVGLAFRNPTWRDGVRANLIKIAALAIAQIESLDRHPRTPLSPTTGTKE